ncbi:MAG: hypothetical protein NZ519_13425 [Bacteroidia bacterium]|nr:hypothetical protein [Bacteroidia bacterium]MDW8348201.1 hypothetical protein [Bacteroidia bacterium]
MKKNIFILTTLAVFLTSFWGCDALLGTKKDPTVDDVFQQGNIDPTTIVSNVGYVPINPVWYFNQPTDVYVGYDEMVYVTDADGLHILDQKGTKFKTIPIPNATDVTQDRRLLTYVIGRVNYPVTIGTNTQIKSLPAIYIIKNAPTNNPQIIDTLIHPFCDITRASIPFRPQDEQVSFTGIATLHDNTFYVSRTGIVNTGTGFPAPDNAVLVFDKNFNNTNYINELDPINTNLRSVVKPTSIASFAAPPQLVSGISTSKDFLLTQKTGLETEYAVLWIKRIDDADLGTVYTENATLLVQDTSKADRFLYQPFRFSQPEDVCVAPDASGYIFVVDSGKDSLFIFNRAGYEGVNKPANSNFRKQVLASFGGLGNGPKQFNNPVGVAYFRKMIYVADKNNNRVCRFKLSTDLQ